MARPHIVIVGAGFGGLAAAHGLAGAAVDVTVIDRRNYHLFQPLLYQVATAGLSPAQIASPIRAILRRAANVRVVIGKVSGIDKERCLVTVDQGTIAYDHLVLATGARHSYFGREDWENAAPGLKKIDDAIGIRRRLLTAFEEAEAASSPEVRRRLLTFVVIGGGPTGVEMAGAIAELGRVALRRDFRNIDPADARVVLVEAGQRLLPTFPAMLGHAAREALQELGVEVRLGTAVTQCDSEGVAIGEERLSAATIVWGAGVMASAAAAWLGVDKDRAGRVVVGPDLTVPDHPKISCIGDTASVMDAAGKPLPGLAPVAKQQGAYVARRLRAALSGKAPPRPFRYSSWGTMATIGRRAAVADLGWVKLDGTLAWLLWSAVHVSFLIGFRNRLVVMLDWLWSYFTFQSGARLITGPGSH
ncbi:NAD(P)/FAD-dependent oxidoreductase [Reyranella soli]|uniref:NADH:ubiquinone reductase (non-electrogenic) n=1 Tax=Reyranella soli TaxID=1230389 RepID=A0A512N9H1_9HYPH|nr:NAD(P)/FAD-dependent oxidoreductase [Reyranella soli]GEP55321.1 NADH dehydrogenase [Reyranella soli]